MIFNESGSGKLSQDTDANPYLKWWKLWSEGGDPPAAAVDPCDDPGGVAGTVVPELLVAPPSLVAAVEGFPAMLPRCAYLVSFPLACSPVRLFLQLMTVPSSCSALLMMLMFFLYNFDDCC